MKSEIDIGYMAGLMDGEGSLNTHRLVDSRTGRITRGFRTNITAVSNSNPLIVARTTEILDSWGIYYVARQTHPRFWAVDVKGNMANKREFLNAILDALRGKKEQARLLIEFFDMRLRGKKLPISEAEQFLLNQVRALNHLHYLGSVTTARESHESVKIQSELGSDAERSAEMTGPTLIKTA